VAVGEHCLHELDAEVIQVLRGEGRQVQLGRMVLEPVQRRRQEHTLRRRWLDGGRPAVPGHGHRGPDRRPLVVQVVGGQRAAVPAGGTRDRLGDLAPVGF
jgi:hypothetical protein